MEEEMKKEIFLLTIILTLIFGAGLGLAWEGSYNYWQNSSQKAKVTKNAPAIKYDVEIKPPVVGSEESSKSQKLGCATAAFSSITINAQPKDENGKKLTKEEIFKVYRPLVDPKNGTAGKFDDNLKLLIEILNKDKEYEYNITIKRINKLLDEPVRSLPKPKIETRGNVKIIRYRPYNFDIYDIAAAMKKSNAVSLGGVYYKKHKNGSLVMKSKTEPLDLMAHMVEAVAVSFKKDNNGNQRIKFYDPYFSRETDSWISKEPKGRTYIWLWNRWFHLEELIYIEKAKKTTVKKHEKIKIPGYYRFFDTPIILPIIRTESNFYDILKPGFCGDGKVQKPNGKNQTEECDDGNKKEDDRCSNSCKLTVCGDGILQKPNGKNMLEECDDGNTKSEDGCSASCKIEKCGDGKVQKGLGEQCEKPGSICGYVDNELGTLPLYCSDTCQCPVRGMPVGVIGE